MQYGPFGRGVGKMATRMDKGRPAVLGIWDPVRNVRKIPGNYSEEIPLLHSSKMVQGPFCLSDPSLPPASVVNSTTSTTSTMEESLIGGVGHLQVLDPLGSALS